MNILDLLITVVVLLQAAQGANTGLLRQFFSLSGFWLGLVLGAALSPVFVQTSSEPLSRLVITFLAVFGFALLGSTIGKYIGHRLGSLAHRWRLGVADKILGAAFSVFVTLFIVWLFMSMFSGAPHPELNRQLKDSWIMRQLDETLPPAPAVISRIARLINPQGFPHVFTGPEPQPPSPVDPATAAQVEAATRAAGTSTVKIDSVGCGGLVNGSGFVAGEGLVITNAHVVAGINRPTILDNNGRHRAETVYFDPNTDLAVLRTNGLAGPPLPLADKIMPRGTAAVALGYPGGGPFRATPAGVTGQFEAVGRDIYNRRVTARSIYALQTTIESGNSGGPLVLPDGTVIGVIFARSETAQSTGYALISKQAREALSKARSVSKPVSTGRCVSA